MGRLKAASLQEGERRKEVINNNGIVRRMEAAIASQWIFDEIFRGILEKTHGGVDLFI